MADKLGNLHEFFPLILLHLAYPIEDQVESRFLHNEARWRLGFGSVWSTRCLIHQIFAVSVFFLSKVPDRFSCLRLLEMNRFTYASTRQVRHNVLLSRRESDSSFSGFLVLATHTNSWAIMASAFNSTESWVTGFTGHLVDSWSHSRVISLRYAYECSVLWSLGLGSKNETFVRVT